MNMIQYTRRCYIWAQLLQAVKVMIWNTDILVSCVRWEEYLNKTHSSWTLTVLSWHLWVLKTDTEVEGDGITLTAVAVDVTLIKRSGWVWWRKVHPILCIHFIIVKYLKCFIFIFNYSTIYFLLKCQYFKISYRFLYFWLKQFHNL